MKLANRIRLVFCAAGALWLASCNDTHETPFDKNTNWLESCASSDACGVGLQCVCGVCTSVCDRDAQCAELAETAVCISIAAMGSACSSDDTVAAASVCSLACEERAACATLNDSLTCVEGGCAPEPMSQTGIDDADASAGGDAAQSDAGADEIPVELDPQAIEAIHSECLDGFECEAKAAAPRGITSIVASDEVYAYWSVWGTRDELDNHRGDGAIVRVGKQADAGAPEAVQSGLDRPWRMWLDGGAFYWLSGEPGPAGVGRGTQTLYAAQADPTGEPLALMSDAFAQLIVRNEELFWLSPYGHLVDGDSVQVQRYSLSTGASVWSEFYIEGDYALAGVDDTHIYLEDGSLNLARGGLDGAGLGPFVSDTPAFNATVDADALWLIHLGTGDESWVSSMSKDDGAITHLGSAANAYGRPQPGASVVWLVTRRPGDTRWGLWTIPKSGGERQLAFRWDVENGVLAQDAEEPVWVADGDEAWVFAYGSLVRVAKL